MQNRRRVQARRRVECRQEELHGSGRKEYRLEREREKKREYRADMKKTVV